MVAGQARIYGLVAAIGRGRDVGDGRTSEANNRGVQGGLVMVTWGRSAYGESCLPAHLKHDRAAAW